MFNLEQPSRERDSARVLFPKPVLRVLVDETNVPAPCVAEIQYPAVYSTLSENEPDSID